jgi:hypothetical protein
MNQEKNNSEKEIRRSAKMEVIYRITLEDGTVEERIANIDVPGRGDMDFSSIEGVKRSFAAYEEATIEAGNRLREEIANDHMREASKKKTGRKE